jgi:hypothetical protein
VKVPEEVNVCILYPPLVVTVPPVAEMELLLPRRLSMEIVPLATPASVRTMVSFNEMFVLDARPSSVLTSLIEIVPVGVGID